MALINQIKDKVRCIYGAKLITFNYFHHYHHLLKVFGIVVEASCLLPPNRILVRWIKPSSGYYKLNTDGAFSNLKAGVGGIIRDCRGNTIMAFAGPSVIRTACLAEILALKYGLNLCNTLGITNVWIELDAQTIIHYISGKGSANPLYLYIIREIKCLLYSFNFVLSHIHREGNAAVDFLADLGGNLNEFMEFTSTSLPPKLVGITHLDRVGMPYIRLG
ncbi:Putative ribonuclease H protein [Dendrobium catenatum]|uniref:Ribonuclease H protein n=1 Tax=Dendrobium catenatum TaxID=906689 RepID=A0A2I0XA97_9ASPA|nr:Putative ribonuclease H protein [Dendrobium catenatum]